LPGDQEIEDKSLRPVQAETAPAAILKRALFGIFHNL
jgi:hypothetical protein